MKERKLRPGDLVTWGDSGRLDIILCEVNKEECDALFTNHIIFNETRKGKVYAAFCLKPHLNYYKRNNMTYYTSLDTTSVWFKILARI